MGKLLCWICYICIVLLCARVQLTILGFVHAEMRLGKAELKKVQRKTSTRVEAKNKPALGTSPRRHYYDEGYVRYRDLNIEYKRRYG